MSWLQAWRKQQTTKRGSQPKVSASKKAVFVATYSFTVCAQKRFTAHCPPTGAKTFASGSWARLGNQALWPHCRSTMPTADAWLGHDEFASLVRLGKG